MANDKWVSCLGILGVNLRKENNEKNKKIYLKSINYFYILF